MIKNMWKCGIWNLAVGIQKNKSLVELEDDLICYDVKSCLVQETIYINDEKLFEDGVEWFVFGKRDETVRCVCGQRVFILKEFVEDDGDNNNDGMDVELDVLFSGEIQRRNKDMMDMGDRNI
jgi:hypothetical protein